MDLNIRSSRLCFLMNLVTLILSSRYMSTLPGSTSAVPKVSYLELFGYWGMDGSSDAQSYAEFSLQLICLVSKNKVR